jgi:hypothetical protein
VSPLKGDTGTFSIILVDVNSTSFWKVVDKSSS